MIYIILMFSIFCSGCSFRSKEMVAFDRVTSRVDRVLAKEENFQVCGTGMLGPGYFKGIHLLYVSPEYVNRDEARRIFIRAVDTIVRIVNQDTDFVQYMKPPPFTSDQLFLNIEFSHDYSDRYIGMMVIIRNKIYYSLLNPDTFKATDIASETLEEAMQIVEAEGMQLNNLKRHIDKQANEEENPPFHSIKTYSHAMETNAREFNRFLGAQ
jgi:hypothetical protein